MTKHERYFGNFMVSLIEIIIVGCFIYSLIDLIRGDFRWLGSYGPYKAYVEYEEADDSF